MSLRSRIANVFRPGRLDSEIDEELRAHIADAIAEGRDPAEARRAFGPALRLHEQSRDLRLIPWLDSLRADSVFAWRQLRKRKATSAAAILSLAIAIGACTSAFRLIDALLLRPLPVAGADRLYSVTFQSPSAVDGVLTGYDSCSYPMFRRFRAEAQDQAEAIAVSMYNGGTDLTYGSDQETERATLQYVSGRMFDLFRLRPAAGRLLTANDDVTPGAHPYAVISYDYWTRRFGRDPRAIGRTFRLATDVFEIVGVSEKRFTGIETGWTTDVFVPMAMRGTRFLTNLNAFWMRILLELKPGAAADPLQERLRATFQSIQEERIKGFPTQSQRDRDRMFAERLSIERAASGRSNLQRDYRQALWVLGLLVALVLLIACPNVANLMAAQAASRGREMALRVSIGAGAGRLAQLILVESAWISLLATAIGGAFAWWSAPFLAARINPPAYAAHLVLPADGRVLGFALALACAVTFLFGLPPALRAATTQPAGALRGGLDPHSRRRLMTALIAVQVAFCFVVHQAAGLFGATFHRLVNQPTGFSAERVLNLESVTSRPQSPVLWDQVAERLRAVPGVEQVALTGWPLMSGQSNTTNISVDGGPPSDVFSDVVYISPGWAGLMRIPLLSGRDFRPGDANPGIAIVNQSFAKQYFHGVDPVGKWFDRVDPAGGRSHIQIVGLIRDARTRDRLRWPIRPTAHVPFAEVDAAGAPRPAARGTFVVRTAAENPLALAATLRREVANARPEFRVRDARTQVEFNQTDSVRERLLATLAAFFAAVALLLAGVGLYGVLDYSVLQRRREIGIRMAVGARPAQIIPRVTIQTLLAVAAGMLAGVALGLSATRYIAAMLYEVRPTDPAMLALPALAILGVALLAALPPAIRAARIDPIQTLRAD